jgi:hypothetical protein
MYQMCRYGKMNIPLFRGLIFFLVVWRSHGSGSMTNVIAHYDHYRQNYHTFEIIKNPRSIIMINANMAKEDQPVTRSVPYGANECK